MKYFYLVASLPALALGEPPPVTAEAFQFSCTGVLAEPELRELECVLGGRAGEGESNFARKWFGADAQLRNATARLRGARLNVEARAYTKDHPGFSAYIEKSAADAFAKGNPLERELALDRCRWQILDELTLENPFGLEAVLAFAVKLQIAARWARMTDQAGQARVEELVNKMEAQS